MGHLGLQHLFAVIAIECLVVVCLALELELVKQGIECAQERSGILVAQLEHFGLLLVDLLLCLVLNLACGHSLEPQLAVLVLQRLRGVARPL